VLSKQAALSYRYPNSVLLNLYAAAGVQAVSLTRYELQSDSGRTCLEYGGCNVAEPLFSAATVVEMGWSGVKNGKLLALAAGEFDAFITVDKSLPYQQNLTTLPVGVVVLDTVSNELLALLPLVPALERALSSIEPRTYTRVEGET